jgi:recombination protein RecT
MNKQITKNVPKAQSGADIVQQKPHVPTHLKSVYMDMVAQKTAIESIIPSHMDVKRVLRVAFSQVARTPSLHRCESQSIVDSVVVAASLGLEIGINGLCYLVPYKGRCQFQLGYKGMIELARRSGEITTLIARAVYENDEFDYSYGLEEKLVHKPAIEKRGNLTHVYAMAKLKDGGHCFDVLTKEDVEKAKRSAASTNGPWSTHYDEMAKKTAIKRLFKYLPVSIEIQNAVALDDAADRGEQFLVDQTSNDEQFAERVMASVVVDDEQERKSQSIKPLSEESKNQGDLLK